MKKKTKYETENTLTYNIKYIKSKENKHEDHTLLRDT